MKERMVFSDIRVEVSIEDVLRLADCYEDSPVYDEVREECGQILAELLRLGAPVVVFTFGKPGEEEVSCGILQEESLIYVFLTEGKGISGYSTRMFQRGDYVKGMLADAAASAYLFALEQETVQILKQECAKRHVGVRRRMEVPVDLPMRIQQRIYDACDAGQLGVTITSGYMYDPVKSNGFILVLSQEEEMFRVQHDCSRCPTLECKMRKEKNV